MDSLYQQSAFAAVIAAPYMCVQHPGLILAVKFVQSQGLNRAAGKAVLRLVVGRVTR